MAVVKARDRHLRSRRDIAPQSGGALPGAGARPRGSARPSPRAVAAALATLALPFLGGCLGAVAAINAVPAVVGTAAMAGTEARSPFVEYARDARAGPDDDLVRLDAGIVAARCGDAAAQYRLAAQLANGYNLSPDRIEIDKWYRLAERGGDARAAPAREALEATMPVAEVARARALAAAWAPAGAECPQPGR